MSSSFSKLKMPVIGLLIVERGFMYAYLVVLGSDVIYSPIQCLSAVLVRGPR